MRIINPSFEFADEINAEQMLDKIEKAYRICYMSEPNGNRNAFIANKIKIGHESPLEHASVSVIITTNRGVTHELVRHRIASYSQSSTRYCNFSKDKFGNEITFVRPAWVDERVLGEYHYGYAEMATTKTFPKELLELMKADVAAPDVEWVDSCNLVEDEYLRMINHHDWTPERARDILNNSVATTIMVTMNLREWRHFFKLRAIGTTGKPHPDMLQITVPMLAAFKEKIPVVFDDLNIEEER